MKNLLLLSFLLVSSYFINAQEHCGQDSYQQRIYEENPSLRPENNLAFQELEEFTRTFQPSSNSQRNSSIEDLVIGTDYIIPVVVHVIHNNGPENISDAAIERSIDMLNIFFAGESAFDNNIDPDFLAVRGSFTGTKLKFVLANFDPTGMPTNGIDRHVDAVYTYTGDDPNMRLTYHWPRDEYFNIYVVAQAWTSSSSSGFATFPPNVDGSTNAYLDGHVMSAWAYGEHGEMWQTWYHNLAHEVGHWLNVYHIWANAGGNGNTLYCDFDDSVTDTPNTYGNSISDLDDFPGVGSVIKCTTKDNYTNMMDYTGPTYAMFTDGQKARMEAALNSTVAERNSLWETTNVLAKIYGCTTGTDSDGDSIPDACDDCPNDINNDSDGDGICDEFDQCVGYPDVNLDANPASSDACDPLIPIINFNNETILTYDTAQDRGVSAIYDNGATLHLSVNAWKAIALNYTITPTTVIEFDFMSTIDGEIHYIGIDDDLTLDTLLSFKLYGTQNVTPSAINNNDFNTYTDADRYTYKHYSIPIGTFFTGNAPYLFFSADNDDYSEAWTSGLFYPGGGSYNDATSFFRNVKIYNNETLSLVDTDISSYLTVHPNPAQDEITITIKNGIVLESATLLDVNGRIIKSHTFKNQPQEKIDISSLSSGIYFIKIISKVGVGTKKIIKL